jgi:hypothetical protein
MRRDEFSIKSNQQIEEVFNIIINKGSEYQLDDDVLSNFKSNAKDLGLTPYQIWAIYFTKHTKSIINQIKKNPNNPNDTNSVENTKSRITDAIAYLLFLNALIEEQK